MQASAKVKGPSIHAPVSAGRTSLHDRDERIALERNSRESVVEWNTPCHGGDGVVVEVAAVGLEATGGSKDQAVSSYSWMSPSRTSVQMTFVPSVVNERG